MIKEFVKNHGDQKVERITAKNIKIKSATLLSIEEYEKHRAVISGLNFDFWWWLRSPGYYSDIAADVGSIGDVDRSGRFVDNDDDAVVPALRIKSSGSDIGRRFRFGDKEFLILSPELAISTSSIGKHCFREEWDAPDANDYEASDVKNYIDRWFEDSMRKEENDS